MLRFLNPNLKEIEADDEEVTSIACHENPNYQTGLARNRKRAFSAIFSYVESKELADASSLLFFPGPPPPLT
jgi:hypothetical protein